MKQRVLHLHEEILLLALRDEKGTVQSSTCIEFPLAGAMIAELLLLGRVRVDEASKKKKLVDLVDGAPTGNDVLDECLDKFRTAKRRASLKTWVMRFRQMKRLKHRVAEGLCRNGVLRAEEDKVLHIFKRTVYPEIDPRPEREMIERLRAAIFRDGAAIDPRTAILVSIARVGHLLEIPFEKKKLKERKKRIERIVNGELTGKATREAIEAMQAAVMVAVVIPAIAASSASH